jgi:hypothetical protein
VAITKSGYPHAHKGTNGRHCAGVESKVLAGEVDESIVLGVTNKTIVELPRTPYGPQGYCLVCGKKSDVDIDTGKITRHGHCGGNNTPSHPYPPSDDELTPSTVYEPVLKALGLKQFGFDPSSHPQSTVPAETRVYYEHNGLELDWSGEEGIGFLNCPYSRPRPWVERAAEYAGGFVCLLNSDHSTLLWEEIVWPKSHFVILLHKRVRFISPHRTGMATAKRPNALVVFDPERRIEWVPDGVLALEKLGKVVVC